MTQQPVIDALYELGAVGVDGWRAIAKKKRPTGERLAPKAIGRECDRHFKGTLARLENADGEAVMLSRATSCDVVQKCSVERMRIEHPANSPENTALSAEGGANSGAVAAESCPLDPDLIRILDAWPTLPPPIRAAVLALIETALPIAPGTPGKAAQ